MDEGTTDCVKLGMVKSVKVMQGSVKTFPTGLTPVFAQGAVNNFFIGVFCTQACRYVQNVLITMDKSFHRLFMTDHAGLLLSAGAG
ncbi:hypothetical protein ACP2AU_04000 [Marinobacter sp. VGCF2001]